MSNMSVMAKVLRGTLLQLVLVDGVVDHAQLNRYLLQPMLPAQAYRDCQRRR